MKFVEWLVVAVIALLVILIAGSLSSSALECSASGKVLVRGVFGWECVSK